MLAGLAIAGILHPFSVIAEENEESPMGMPAGTEGYSQAPEQKKILHTRGGHNKTVKKSVNDDKNELGLPAGGPGHSQTEGSETTSNPAGSQ